MARLSEIFKSARTSAGLSAERMEQLLNVNAGRVMELEGGAVPTPTELDDYALAFGVTVAGLSRGDATRSPASRLLFRASQNDNWRSIDALSDTDAHRVFGDFLRCVHELVELESVLSDAPSATWHSPASVPADEQPPYGADELADWLRGRLDLGQKPIESMHKILDRLGVSVFFVTPEELDPSIDGASTSFPRRAVLVNLVQGPGCWWRTRMTLAHELCHLLLDHRGETEPYATISPVAVARRRGSSRPAKHFDFYEGFDFAERRAGAFAACFLAPASAIKEVVGDQDPTSEDAIIRVASTFGLGRITACSRLKHVFGLSNATRDTMLAQSSVEWQSPRRFSSDRGPAEAGLRTGVIKQKALEALALHKIDRPRCYGYLRLRLTEWLPEHPGLSLDLRRPLRDIADTIRGVAQQYLEQKFEIDLIATAVEAGPNGWRVKVIRRPSNDLAGTIVVSWDRVVRRFDPCAAI